MREADGKPVALALHKGHYELDIQMRAAADVIKANRALPYAVYVSNPFDSRAQGTIGMFDPLPYRNDALMVMRRLIRSLPGSKAVIGAASCDKGLRAIIMALAPQHDIATLVMHPHINLALITLATGAGSYICSHVNDASFWMIKDFFGLTP